MRRHLASAALLFCLSGFAFAQPTPQITPRPPTALVCKVFYRSSVTQPIQQEATLEFHLGSMQDKESRFQDLEFHAFFHDDEFDGRALSVSILRRDNGQVISRQLYQMSSDSLPVNQFVGQHGYSGLNYVYHPVSGAEIQYILESKPPAPKSLD